MAEESLLVEIRAATDKFNQDMKRIQRDADKAMRDVEKSLGRVEKGASPAAGELRKLNKTFDAATKESRKLAKETQDLSRSFGSLKGVIAGLGLGVLAHQATRLASDLIRSAEALTGVELGLTQALGSAQLAGDAFAFVRAEANRLAVNTIDAARSFARLNNSVKNTALEGEGARLIFQAFNEASVAMRLSQDELSRVFLQVNQAIARQKFETEDLNSITEAGIPVYRLLQETLNLTGTEFRKSLEAGQIGLNELIILADRLRREYGGIADTAAQTVPAQFRRMFDEVRTEAALFTQDLLKTGELQGLVDEVRRALNQLKNDIDRVEIVEFFKTLVREATAALRIIIGVSNALSKIGNALDKGLDAVNKAGEAGNRFFRRLLGESEDALQALDDSIETSFTVTHPKAVEKGQQQVTEIVRQAHENRAKLQSQASVAELKQQERERLRLLDQQKRLEERAARELLDVVRENNSRIAREAARAEELARDSIVTGKPVLGPLVDSEATKAAKEAAEEQAKEFEAIFARAADNIQDSFADLFSDTLQGDLPRIQSFADSVQSIFANMAAAIVTEQLIKPLLEEAVSGATDLFKKDGAIGKLLGENVRGNLGTAIGGAGLGLAVGSTASRVLGGSPAGSAASGALGGAAAGATIGSAFPGYGTIIGAVVGAIAGGAFGFFSAPSEKTSRADLQTIPRGGQFARPVQDSARVRTPFGDIGVGGRRIESGDFLSAVAELDRQIARLLPQHLRDRVEATFRAAENTTVGKNEGAALAQIIQQRGFDAIKAVLGTGVAETVAGPRGQVSSAGIQSVQARVAEALGIVRQIEEFKIGPLSDVGEAVKAINDRFGDLIISAEAFGIGTAEIAKEQQRLLREITSDVNADIRQRTLEIVDPAKAAFEELRKAQEEDLQRVKDANADVAAAERLHVLEREELRKRLAETSDGINGALDNTTQQLEGLRAQIAAFFRAGLSTAAQQLAALSERFHELRDEAQRLGRPIAELTTAYNAQRREIALQPQRALNQATAQITDPFGAAMMQLGEQVRQFQRDVQAGLISQSALNRFTGLSARELHLQEGLRLAGGGGDTASQLRDLANAFIQAGQPIRDVDRELQALKQQFDNLLAAYQFLNGPTKALTASYQAQREAIIQLDRAQVEKERRAAQNQVFDIIRGAQNPTLQFFTVLNREIKELAETSGQFVSARELAFASGIFRAQGMAEEALSRIGGASSPIRQVADAFDSFIRAGNPLTSAGQQLFNLTENFLNLKDAADLLGLSSQDLEASYLDQAKAIRENIIAEIDQSLAPRRQAVEQASQFINRLRIGDELPNNLRLDEAQQQFRDLAASGDIAAAIQAAEQLRQIARESFGSTAAFFDIRNDILGTIENLRQQEEAAIQAERDRLIREETRQLESINLQRNSLDSLQRIQGSSGDVARGIETLIRLERQNADRFDDLGSLLRQVLA